MDTQTSVLELKGIGKKTAGLFAKLDITTVGDLLAYYPRDYEKFGEICPAAEVKKGEVNAVRVTVSASPSVKRAGNLTIVSVWAGDATGQIQILFFNMPFLRNTIKAGGMYLFRGFVRDKEGRTVMEHPKIYTEEEYLRRMQKIQPLYPLTAGLSNKTVEKAVKQALEGCAIEEHMPDWLIEEEGLAPLQDAVQNFHFPADYETLFRARKRIAFDEFFFFRLALCRMREKNEELMSIFPYADMDAADSLAKSLPFRLTGAQEKAWEEIKEDMQGRRVMNRLVQGDVGSGKTILAILALAATAANGYQGALMAPTEVLAKQHFNTLVQMAQDYNLPVRPVLLTGSLTAREKRQAYCEIQEGGANVIIGTHALIQEKAVYHKLALVVTDEQHRFGVRQREKLAAKGEEPHILVMSATPIPRTLAIILYGDLNVSVIDELPADRKPVKNCVVETGFRNKAYKFIEGEVAGGHQAYIICPMVEEGEQEGLENVLDYAEKIKPFFSSGVRIGVLHGRMRADQKDGIMEAFKERLIDVLVSTTVIEVGINVPNATVMMVENAERFGLAQLHQLRGRVGRGESQSYCIFISSSEKKETLERLEILNRSNDGFKIAEEDLKLRGPGDLFGIRQSGDMEFAVADIYQDADILYRASSCVDRVLAQDPELIDEKNRRLWDFLNEGGGNAVDFRTL